ncbi:DinB family protein [Mucilaginibacter lutimaris]|uniref:DinB family protein n=1 Tax=Mucilaginibacter lutimaris TaxID=931629 RepID=A0ABW2ZE24_9SPHI
MLNETLRTLFKRDLEKLRTELNAYQAEPNIWRVDQDIANSVGNLALHLIGNLNTYIGAILGGTDYVRDRPAEFASKDVPRSILIVQLDRTIVIVDAALKALRKDQMKGPYPQDVGTGDMTTEYFLLHLAMHLSYHLGQVNYHRRFLDH